MMTPTVAPKKIEKHKVIIHGAIKNIPHLEFRNWASKILA